MEDTFYLKDDTNIIDYVVFEKDNEYHLVEVEDIPDYEFLKYKFHMDSEFMNRMSNGEFRDLYYAMKYEREKPNER